MLLQQFFLRIYIAFLLFPVFILFKERILSLFDGKRLFPIPSKFSSIQI